MYVLAGLVILSFRLLPSDKLNHGTRLAGIWRRPAT